MCVVFERIFEVSKISTTTATIIMITTTLTTTYLTSEVTILAPTQARPWDNRLKGKLFRILVKQWPKMFSSPRTRSAVGSPIVPGMIPVVWSVEELRARILAWAAPTYIVIQWYIYIFQAIWMWLGDFHSYKILKENHSCHIRPASRFGGQISEIWVHNYNSQP